MPTRRFERKALAQLLVGGCAIAFSACVLIEHAQAQPGYVPPPKGQVEWLPHPRHPSGRSAVRKRPPPPGGLLHFLASAPDFSHPNEGN
jgi:hypothetical protein